MSRVSEFFKIVYWDKKILNTVVFIQSLLFGKSLYGHFYAVVFHMVTTVIRSKFIRFKIYSIYNLYGSNFSMAKIYTLRGTPTIVV
jgi:hypothetical protein